METGRGDGYDVEIPWRRVARLRYSRTPPALALLRGAELAAWRGLGNLPRAAARKAYVDAVSEERAARAAPRPPTPRRRPSFRFGPAGGVADKWRADRELVDAPLESLSREALLAHARRLRERVQTLSVGHVMKAGDLMRYRETMMGHDWAPRYFEVVPGFLRCSAREPTSIPWRRVRGHAAAATRTFRGDESRRRQRGYSVGYESPSDAAIRSGPAHALGRIKPASNIADAFRTTRPLHAARKDIS